MTTLNRLSAVLPSATPKTGSRARRRKKAAKLSHLHRPDNLSLEEWQTRLRREFGREQKFRLKNIGSQPVFSEFHVTNPKSGSTYRVAIRGTQPGENFCSCPDFATNTLGTCKHVEFTLAKLERQSGGRAALRAGFQPAYSEIVLEYGAQRVVRFRDGRECPPSLAVLAAKYFGSDRSLKAEAFATFETFLSAAAKFEHDLRCYDDVLAFVAEVRDRARRVQIIRQAFPRGIASGGLKDLLRCQLFDYQKEGALFAASAGRCLIGDDMGLGKTIQAIAAAEIMSKHLGVERVLVVSPTSLKHQWEREISRFAGRDAVVIGGMRPTREKNFATPSFFKITNYDTIHRDLDLINAWAPDLVILDEAQRIKNWNTRAARSVKKIASPYAIVLTGTPLENRLQELVSIVEFVDKHRLGPTFRFLADHQLLEEDSGKVIGYHNLDQIGKSLAPVLIRRHKKDVLKQLPARLDKNFFVTMTKEQLGLHDENREIVAKIVQKWRRYRFLTEADQRRLMICLQNMRMSCDSTYLLDHKTDIGSKADELTTLLAEIFEEPNTKVVIFSQWLRMHELLVQRFEKRRWDHVLFHGGVPGTQRKGLVDRFREDSRCRAFLATDAGGVGLNLQHASVVINMDLPWNPAVLEQRIARVHRLGQSNPVRVVNFVAKGTIEEGMLGVLKFKQSLFSGVLDGGEKEVFLGGSRLTKFMETVEKTTGAIPETIAEESPVDGEGGEKIAAAATGSDETEAMGKTNTTSSAAPSVASDPWTGLIQSGVALLEQLAAATRRGPSDALPERMPTAKPGLSIVHRDEATGESYLKLPLPSPEVLDRALQTIGVFLQGFQK
jgi:superfamily II DNA or RNA helicase